MTWSARTATRIVVPVRGTRVREQAGVRQVLHYVTRGQRAFGAARLGKRGRLGRYTELWARRRAVVSAAERSCQGGISTCFSSRRRAGRLHMSTRASRTMGRLQRVRVAPLTERNQSGVPLERFGALMEIGAGRTRGVIAHLHSLAGYGDRVLRELKIANRRPPRPRMLSASCHAEHSHGSKLLQSAKPATPNSKMFYKRMGGNQAQVLKAGAILFPKIQVSRHIGKSPPPPV